MFILSTLTHLRLIRSFSTLTILTMLLQPGNAIERWSEKITADYTEPRAARIFFNALVIFTAIKMMFIWTVTKTMILHHSPSLSKSLSGRIVLAPAYFAYDHPDIFFFSAIAVLGVMLFVRQNYVFNLLFFWITLNLYAINLPISNGSDIVLFMLSLWCIPMVQSQKKEEDPKTITERVCFNLAVIFCQIQIACMYVVSGWDKLANVNWRTGEALIYIQHLELLYNPILPDAFTSSAANAILAWIAIVFELSFPVLVWRKKTRLIIILCGTIFHLFIWIVLSLPDFAWIMILSYLIF